MMESNGVGLRSPLSPMILDHGLWRVVSCGGGGLLVRDGG